MFRIFIFEYRIRAFFNISILVPLAVGAGQYGVPMAIQGAVPRLQYPGMQLANQQALQQAG